HLERLASMGTVNNLYSYAINIWPGDVVLNGASFEPNIDPEPECQLNVSSFVKDATSFEMNETREADDLRIERPPSEPRGASDAKTAEPKLIKRFRKLKRARFGIDNAPHATPEPEATESECKPLVSILVPVYNSAPYIEETLSSLTDQTYPNIEIDVLDDGSQDASLGVAKKCARADHRIRILASDGKNRGVVATRNSLLKQARGAFIAWNDSDDLSSPERIAKQVAYLNHNPGIGAVGTGILIADAKLHPLESRSFPEDPERQAVDPELCCATVLLRREAADHAGLFREAFHVGGEDGDWVLKVADKHRITNIPEILYTYRRHPASLTHKQGHSSLVRRLGVVARQAARARRAGEDDPVDLLEADKIATQLDTEHFLFSPNYTTGERMAALQEPIEGEKPALSIILRPVSTAEEIEAIVDAYRAQSFQSFEVIVPAKQCIFRMLDKRVAGFKLVLVPSRMHTKSADRLLLHAGAPYVLVPGSNYQLPQPWEVHNQFEALLELEPATIFGAALRGDGERIPTIAELQADPMVTIGARSEDLRKLALGQASFIKMRRLHTISVRLRQLIKGGVATLRQGHYREFIRLAPTHALQFANMIAVRTLEAFARQFYNVLAPALFRLPGFRILVRSKAGRYARSLVRTIISPKGRSAFVSDSLSSVNLHECDPIDYELAARRAEIKVAVLDNWGDVEECLQYMTPNGDGIYDGVLFAPHTKIDDPDFTLVLNMPENDNTCISTPPERLFFAIGEPPTAEHHEMH
ncbi:MAG: glycosyltransferase family 2 protein, partial [Hyphomonas sp.]|nr:glycosyltransferase family 2 protein [Hyphomonas sp.]